MIPGVLSPLPDHYRPICLRKIFCPVQIQQCHLSPRHSCHRSVMTNCTNLISEGSQQAGGMVNVEILFHSTKKSQHLLGVPSDSIQTQHISMHQQRRSWQLAYTKASPKWNAPFNTTAFPLPKHQPVTDPWEQQTSNTLAIIADHPSVTIGISFGLLSPKSLQKGTLRLVTQLHHLTPQHLQDTR